MKTVGALIIVVVILGLVWGMVLLNEHLENHPPKREYTVQVRYTNGAGETLDAFEDEFSLTENGCLYENYSRQYVRCGVRSFTVTKKP